MQKQKIVDNKLLRQEISELIASGKEASALSLLSQLWVQNPDSATAGYILSTVEKLRGKLPMSACRIAVLRSFTVEPCVPLLRAVSAVRGIDLTVYLCDFNTYVQDILNKDSGLYRFNPDIVILAVQTRDIAPELWDNGTNLSTEDITTAVNRVINSFKSWIHVFRSYSQAHMIIHTLETPSMPSNGLLDLRAEIGQMEAIQQINAGLHQIAVENKGVYLLDYDALISRYGKIAWHDERKWLTMRMPISANCLVYLVNEWMRFIHPLTGRICKALVTDLDNTLWGGIIGEDGFDGIKIGQEYPGRAYYVLQRVMLDLYNRGILLAICSKNNLSDAMDVLERHPNMLLRPHHFAAIRINWNDKVRNLKEIAEELNIGTDALAFLDDNPFERQLVCSQMPEVTIIDLPEDPMGYADALRNSPVFERLTISSEDRERGRYYVEQRQRRELQQSAASLEDFYRSLEMEIEISTVTQQTLSRIAQLTQRTNQFNLTTKRYTEQQIEEMANHPDWCVYSLRVKDRFGDSGIVGVAVMHYRGDICEIDSFLLSCRVIGRTIETAFLAFIAEQAYQKNAQRLAGWFLPTKKNEPAKNFYSSHGFTMVQEKDGASYWEFDLTGDKKILSPPWIKRVIVV